MADWTDEKKQEVIEAYEAANPTPETTLDIIKELADEYNETPNGVRMVLIKAKVYVKKNNASSSGSSSSGDSGNKRVSKADAIEGLKEAIRGKNKEVDDDICDRLTGKAAVYITELLS